MDKLLFLFHQVLKYRNPDTTIGFSKTLIVTGLSLITAGTIWSVGIQFDLFVARMATSFGPTHTNVFGLALLIVGVLVGLWRIKKVNERTTGLLIVHRGMEGMETMTPQSALPSSFSNGRLEIVNVDEVNQLDHGKVHRPHDALKAIADLPRQISTRTGNHASADLKLAYAGLAPVPLLVAAGYVISSRQKCLILDYRRGSGWHCLDVLDDDEDVTISPPLDVIGQEVAITLPFSVAIARDQLPETLQSKAYTVDLSAGARLDSMESEQKQVRIARQIYSFISNLKSKHPSLEEIHIYMATQASFSFRFGTMITTSVHPSIKVYQYDPSSGGYTWGVGIENGKDIYIVD